MALARASRFREVNVDEPVNLLTIARAAAKTGKPVPGHWPGAVPMLADKSSKRTVAPHGLTLWDVYCDVVIFVALLVQWTIDAVQDRNNTIDALKQHVKRSSAAVPSLKSSIRSLTLLFLGPLFVVVGVRADPTNYCTRWSHQSAMMKGGTLYVYGGRASQNIGQTDNTWNNDFLTLDLTKTWQIGTPTIKGLDQPSGPPAVANGYLWHSDSSLFLYGGEYSDHPVTSPAPFAMWQYDTSSNSWSKHSDPKTSAGNSSDGGNQPVQNAAEGAGLSVPQLGRGWYFGGHLDGYTSNGWSQSTPRVYLKSMIEYTFPGASNNGVDSLHGSATAGSDGAWRNITSGGLQETAGFTERADGILVYVPGFAAQGIILGLAGGGNVTFTQLNVIDVYDVSTSTWYKQATSGPSPPYRVNPCAVAASAPDGSSTNIYMFGGQNLTPAGDQTQYDDVWILTVPSFTWIKVDTSNQPTPLARAGHTCDVWDGQMVVVGGYVGANVSCDSPGIYVFDMTELKWQTQFTALSGSNAYSQQSSQTSGNSGLAGSYGYRVPESVQSVVGGDENGGATATKPVASATAGPLASGHPQIYTVTTTALPGAAPAGASGPNVAAIIAGVVAGVCFVAACYLGFCAWVYRRQLNLYKNHVSAGQRAALAGGGAAGTHSAMVGEKTGFMSGEPSSTSGGVPSSGPASTGPSSRRPGAGSDEEDGGDLLFGREPTFVGVLMRPRQSLRVVNRD